MDYEVTSEGTEEGAVAGEDFVAQSGTLVWNDGEIIAKQIEVEILDDDQVEQDEQVKVKLSNPAGAILASTVQALVTIKDDDSYGTIELGRTEYSFNENGKEARIFVIRKGGFVGTQELSFSTVDLTAVSSGEMPDYGAISGTLTLESGQSGSSFVINLFDDGSLENTEQFSVVLSDIVGGAEFGDKTQAVVNILDNEALNVPSGNVDVTFDLGTGANGIINTLEILPGGKLLIGGDFKIFNGIPVPNFTRLLSDGNIDSSFVPPARDSRNALQG